MKAETAYNVCMSLEPGELQRLLAMLHADNARPAVPAKTKRSGLPIWSHAECYEIILKQLQDRKKNKKKDTVSRC